MATAGGQLQVPWRKLGLTALAAGAYAFFWINGPLQERAPVFEFEEHMTGFAEPVKMGEEYQTPTSGMVHARDEHPYYHIMAAREPAPPTYAVIGDARTNPGLKEDVAKQVFAHAKVSAADPSRLKLKPAPDLFYVEETDASGRPTQIYLENTGLNRNVKGYAGPIDIGVVVGADGRIRSVRHLHSMETSSYLTKIEKAGFYDQFKGIPLDGKSYQVDLVSGASLSTEGIARSVTQLVSIARDSPLGLYSEESAAGFDVKAVLPSTWVIEAALIAALFVVAWLRRLRRWARLSLAIGIVSVAYLGFYLNDSFTYVTFTQPFLGVRWSWVLGVYATLVLASAVWDANSYCRYVCPYGNVQRLLVRVFPFRGKLPVSNRILEWVRYAIAACLVAGIATGLPDWGSFELFPDLFGLEVLNSPWFWLSAAVILVSAYYPMLWCRALCPTGAVLDGITYLARAREPRAARHSGLEAIPVRVEPARG